MCHTSHFQTLLLALNKQNPRQWLVVEVIQSVLTRARNSGFGHFHFLAFSVMCHSYSTGDSSIPSP